MERTGYERQGRAQENIRSSGIKLQRHSESTQPPWPIYSRGRVWFLENMKNEASGCCLRSESIARQMHWQGKSLVEYCTTRNKCLYFKKRTFVRLTLWGENGFIAFIKLSFRGRVNLLYILTTYSSHFKTFLGSLTSKGCHPSLPSGRPCFHYSPA
jgi:hypothetical protein